MTPAINSFAKDNQPFLSTMEMFRSRTMKESEVDQYVLASAAERLKILLLQKQNISREQLLDLLKTWETPRFIDKIEWYASTNDMCNVMQWLKQKDSQEMLDILSINVPLVDTDFNKMVKYAGYKGGSEPGVLTMSYLFQTQDSKWGCFSFAENDVKKSIDQNSAFQTVQAAMELVLRPQIQTNHHVK